jgi:uncharacterized membrane protein (DUF2068 family)
VRLSSAIRAAALFEAGKGAIVLLAGFGLLSLVHHDVQGFAERLIAHAHLNPASRYPRIFIDLAARATDSRLFIAACAALLYSAVRFIEAYGLWRARWWAEWFAALSAGLYVPFELVELRDHFSWMVVGMLVANLAVIGVMALAVMRGLRLRRQS